MSSTASHKVTKLLRDWSNGDHSALDELMPLVERELHRLARHYMRLERADHTLRTTALVNEAYLKLVDQNRVQWKERAHFFVMCAELMRRILVDHARKRKYEKRGGGAIAIPLDEGLVLSPQRGRDLIALDYALERLAEVDPRKSKIVELRFFGGLQFDEVAEALDISVPTAKRDWIAARAWLYSYLNNQE